MFARCYTEKDVGDFANQLVETQYSPRPADANCKRTAYKETVNSIDWKSECTGKFTMTTEGSVKFDTTGHYKGTVKVKGKAGGNPVDSNIVLEGVRRHACIATLHDHK